jgi:serine/threonine protein kinase
VDARAADFGKYELVARLGHGGMADVYLSILRGPSGFNKLVVIKSMRSAVADDENFRTMMLDEARLAARLQHPNVVQTLEVGDLNGRPFIAMEYLDGQALNTILAAARKAKSPLNQAMVVKIVCEALAGLHYSHELQDYDGKALNIVHRDISPHNMFVTYEGEVKIVDFGIAKAATNAAQTELGTVKGKVAYMAPEQAKGINLDRRVDLFAMGLVLWEMLACRRMLEGDSTIELLEKLLREPIPRVRDVRPEVDSELEGVVMRALERDPKDRFQSAQEMRAALLPFAAGSSREDIGRTVQTMFEAERTRIHLQIQDSMRSEPAEAESATVTMHTPSFIPEMLTGSQSAVSAPLRNALSVSVPAEPPAAKPRRMVTTALLIAASLGLVLFVVLRTRGTPETSAKNTTTNTAPAAPPPPTTPSEPSEPVSASPPPATVQPPAASVAPVDSVAPSAPPAAASVRTPEKRPRPNVPDLDIRRSR